MPIITQIKSQSNNPKRFDIYLDDQFSFEADEDLIVNYRLIKGKSINKEELTKYVFEVNASKLTERIYRLLAIRLRSEKEIRDYLNSFSFKQKTNSKEEISQQSIDFAIDKLKTKGFIDDLEFAKAWVESRRRSKNKGKVALKFELLAKGIENEIITQVLINNNQDQEFNLAMNTLNKKIESFKNLPPREFKKKATDYLLRKGFQYSLISQVLSSIKV